MDTLSLDQFTGLTENGAASSGSTLNTGELRRQYNFGSYVNTLRPSQDAFFTLASYLGKKPTDDPQFKFTEERQSWHKRYAYVVAWSADGSTYTTNDATVTASLLAQGATLWVKFKTDYKSAGNIGSVYGNANSKVDIGDSGTRPQFLFPNLEVKIVTGSAYNSPADYVVGRIVEVSNGSSEDVIAKLHIVRGLNNSSNNELQWASATAPMSTVYNKANATSLDGLESKRCYVVGNAHSKGSGYPETWADQPYSTGYGQTQIWKTAFGMDNTTMATVMKYSPNEWARIWGNKLIEHKWDIANDQWFSTQYTDSDGIQYTQGIVDYVINYGQTFSLTHATKTVDDFLDDMSQYVDPRANTLNATVFFADTYTYNWLNKMSGFFNNNISINSQYRADFAFKGTSNALGLAFHRISTIYGDMNIVRDIHLDGTGVHLVGANMNAVKWRPLAGNGINRDTSIYPGVQTLQNSGIDKRVDLILTEGGMQFTLPETWAIWT